MMKAKAKVPRTAAAFWGHSYIGARRSNGRAVTAEARDLAALIAEGCRHHAAMTPGPWACDSGSRFRAFLVGLEKAAIAWWRSKRPVDWSQAEHLKNPTINVATEREAGLALAVARHILKSRKT